jgi:hypothetical protein
MLNIFRKKKKLRIGSNILRNLLFHLQFTQMIACQYKRYIDSFGEKKKKMVFAVSTGLMPKKTFLCQNL